MNNENLNSFYIGAKLREYRKKCNLTLAEVAKIVKRAPSSVSAWERGESNVDPDTFITLCVLYKVESMGVFYGEPTPDDDLSIDERRLIAIWRSLDEKEKKAFLTVLNALKK